LFCVHLLDMFAYETYLYNLQLWMVFTQINCC